ncbi:hypothetical protein IH992_29105 [Candidatus Poribacteria bacterium]|nr:hypothetical protein [Candidatus Poribacteria bacterium]
MNPLIIVLCTVVMAFASATPTVTEIEKTSQKPDTEKLKLPEGNSGIAAKYPGDVGMDKDPNVVFVENFEGVDAVNALKDCWESVQNIDIMSFSNDTPPGSFGKQSLLMTHIGGESNGGHLYRRLLPGHEKLYLRFYVKFHPDGYPIHHFVHMGGYNPPTPWPQGGAGIRPHGDKRFSTGIEPHGQRWVWDYYTYWCEMRGSPPRGQTWGNSFIRDSSLSVARGKWTCVELMMKMNDSGETNGEIALWLDGRLVSHLHKGFPKGKWIYDKFILGEGGEAIRWNDAKGETEFFEVSPGGHPFEGFRWRTEEKLNLNFLWLLLYITKAPAGHVSQVYFDDIVVATEYIGPIAK